MFLAREPLMELGRRLADGVGEKRKARKRRKHALSKVEGAKRKMETETAK